MNEQKGLDIDLKKKKTHYHADGVLFLVMFDGVRCTCGANVFHETTSDGETVNIICNACGARIGTLTPDAAKEALGHGAWH